jgi:UDP-N-acetylmuramoyl-L-alanyl-D-glutamate--2,6-diaminopimelate ligase
MKKINDILRKCNIVETIGRDDRTVASLVFDSRKASEDVAFFAVRGTQVDGHDYISKSIEQGCHVVVCERIPENIADDVTYYVVDNTAKALGLAASEFYGRPSEKLHLVGVTGTNGKTTIATLLYRLFFNAGYPCGLLSTIENRINNVVVPSTHTTGDQLQINEMLSKMVDAGCEYAFMEVSSHAVDQDRIAGLRFEGGIFTNLTHDHLDYHKTVAAYRDAKKKFFDNLPSSAFALTNLDDKNGMVMLQNTKSKKKTYSLRTDADFKGVVLESYFDGMELKINRNK